MSLPPITIDILILAAFLLLNIVVGFRYRGKNQSFKEYAVGDKKFSTAVLTATIVATWMSGSVLFIDLERTYSSGLYFIIAVIVGRVAGLLLTGHVIGARMDKFLNNVSVPESLGKLYGKAVQAVSGIGAVLSAIGYITIQLQVISRILTILFSYEGPEIVIISAIIITFYSLSGGVKAVTFTDVLQFFTFGTILPILALAIWNKIQDHSQITHMLATNPLFSFKKVVRWSPEFMGTLALMFYLMTPSLPPQLFQRMVMARDTAQVKRSMGYATVIGLAIDLCIIWIAIMTLADKPGLEPNRVLQYIVNAYAYPGLKGFLGIGVIALAMSTADSVLNSCAVIIANDILPPLGLQKTSSLSTARWSTLLLGTLALMMALRVQDLLKILLGSANFYAPIVVMPMLLSIFGFQTSRRVVLMAMGAGAVTACLLYFKSVSSFFPGMIVNFLVMVGAHYLLGEKGGWGHNPIPISYHKEPLSSQWRQWKRAIVQFRLYSYLQQNLPKNEVFYFFFGLYTMAATYAAFYTIGNTDRQACQAIYTGIYHTVLPMATAFLTFPVWPAPLKNTRFMAFFWPLGIGAILFFAGTLLAIMSHFHHMHVMIMMINLLMAVLLLRWPLALFLAFTGTALAVFFFGHYTGTPLPLSAIGSLQLIYALLLFTVLLIVLKNKQAHHGLAISYAQLQVENSGARERWLVSLQHRARLLQEANLYQLDALEMTSQLHEQRNAYSYQHSKEQLMADNAALQQHTYRLDLLNRHLYQVLHQAQDPLLLVVDTLSLQALLKDVFEETYKHDKTIQVRTEQCTTRQALQADVGKVKRLLLAGLLYAREHRQADRPILLGLEETMLAYPIVSIPGYIKRIEALRMTITTDKTLPRLKKCYLGSVDSPSLWLPKNRAELSITYNQQIVDAHYGAVELVAHNPGVTQVYVIPLNVREVRPPTMDRWVVPTPDQRAETPVHPAEASFVMAVYNEKRIDGELVRQAVQIIKQYHAGVNRYTGEPYYLHPIAVAHILLKYTQDQNTILAALLHGAIDDTHLSLIQVALRFNPVVQRIVDGVARVDSCLQSFKRIQLSTYEIIRKLLEVRDERVLYVKLADRLHNMRTIEGHSSLAKQKKIAEETLQFFVPTARHLKLHPIEKELQQLASQVLNKS